MDTLDFLAHNRKEEYLTGYHRITKQSEPVYFEYGIENERSNAYYVLSQSLLISQESIIIRTTWDMNWDKKQYVTTQDGKLWQIHEITTRISVKNKQVSRLLRINPSSEYVISLIAVDNSMEMK